MGTIIVNSNPRYTVNKLAIQAAVTEVLQQNKVSGHVEVGITIVGDRKMHEINKMYRGLDTTTNILSFALEDPTSPSQLQHIPQVGFIKSPDKVLRLGDIVISYPQAIKDAATEGTTIEVELLFLVRHGTKHLLGIHHS